MSLSIGEINQKHQHMEIMQIMTVPTLGPGVPGSIGAHDITSHAWGAVPFTLDSTTGLIFVCTFEYTRKGVTTWRFPFGKARGDSTVWHTLNKELTEELAPRDRQSFTYRIERDIVYFELAADEHRPGGIHLKGFSAIKPLGTLRDFRVIEDEGKPDEEVLDPPFWLEATEALRRMEETTPDGRRKGLTFHRNALVATVSFLAEEEARSGSGKKLLIAHYGGMLTRLHEEIIREKREWESVRRYAGSYQTP